MLSICWIACWVCAAAYTYMVITPCAKTINRASSAILMSKTQMKPKYMNCCMQGVLMNNGDGSGDDDDDDDEDYSDDQHSAVSGCQGREVVRFVIPSDLLSLSSHFLVNSCCRLHHHAWNKLRLSCSSLVHIYVYTHTRCPASTNVREAKQVSMRFVSPPPPHAAGPSRSFPVGWRPCGAACA